MSQLLGARGILPIVVYLLQQKRYFFDLPTQENTILVNLLYGHHFIPSV